MLKTSPPARCAEGKCSMAHRTSGAIPRAYAQPLSLTGTCSRRVAAQPFTPPYRAEGIINRKFWRIEMNMSSKLRAAVLVSLFALGVAGCSGHRGVESTGDVTKDSWITTKVKSELLADKQVSGTHISVKTYEGVVTLG